MTDCHLSYYVQQVKTEAMKIILCVHMKYLYAKECELDNERLQDICLLAMT